jgi:hypothetical protein
MGLNLYGEAVTLARAVVLVAGALAISTANGAEPDVAESGRIADQNELTVAMFQCAHLARHGALGSEYEERLFNDGIAVGREFLKGFRAGKVSAEDQKKRLAVLWLSLKGPSDDFILGRAFELLGFGIEDDVGPDLYSEAAKVKARNLFRSKSCAVLRRL